MSGIENKQRTAITPQLGGGGNAGITHWPPPAFMPKRVNPTPSWQGSQPAAAPTNTAIATVAPRISTPINIDELPYYIRPTEMRMMFTRYGLVKENALASAQNNFYGVLVERAALSPEGAPTVSDYRYFRKPIRDGYLYVFNETLSQERGQDMWFEFKIEKERLIPIVWPSNPGNIREPQPGAQFSNGITVKVDSVLKVAYSDTQWSVAYTRNAMQNRNSNNRFQTIDTQDWFQKIDSSGIARVSIPAILHDPIGAANDICTDADKVYNEFQACVSVIQTGARDERELARRSQTGELAQSQALFTQASIFYKMFHDPANEPSADRTWRERRRNARFMAMGNPLVTKEFLERMLGINERASLRDRINRLRDGILRLINSIYYTKVTEDYRRNTPFRRELGIFSVLSHIQRFAFDPSLADQAIDSSSVESDVTPIVGDYLSEVFNNNDHPIYCLFAEQFDIQEMIDESAEVNPALRGRTIDSDGGLFTDFIQRTNLIWSNMFTIYGIWAKDMTEIIRLVEAPKEWFNKMTLGRRDGKFVWITRQVDLNEALRKRGFVYAGSFETRGAVDILPLSDSHQQTIARAVPSNTRKIGEMIGDPKLFVKRAPNRILTGFDKVFTSRGFITLSGLISAGNSLIAIDEAMRNDNRGSLATAAGAFAIASAVAEVGMWITYYASLHANATREVLARYKTRSKLLGNFAIGFLAASHFVTSVNAFRKGDIRTGIVYAISTLCFSLGLAAATSKSIMAKWKFWPAVILFAIGAGITYWFLPPQTPDIPITRFFRNSILSRRAMEVVRNWNSLSASGIHLQLLAQRNAIVNSRIELRDMEVSLDRLMTFFITVNFESGNIVWSSRPPHEASFVAERVRATIRPVHTDTDATLRVGLWMWMRRGERSGERIEKLVLDSREITDNSIIIRKTDAGEYEITFDLSQYRSKFLEMRWVRAYFYHHFVLSDGETIFPGNDRNKFHMRSRILRDIINPATRNAFDYSEIGEPMVESLEHLAQRKLNP